MKKIDHIGIAVTDLKTSNILFEKLLGTQHYNIEEVVSEDVLVSFFKTENSKIELLQSTDENSAIAQFINKRGEGMHHIAFQVADITFEIERLKKEGFKFVDDQPKKGADNKLVAFLHPKSSNGVLVELCQDIEKED